MYQRCLHMYVWLFNNLCICFVFRIYLQTRPRVFKHASVLLFYFISWGRFQCIFVHVCFFWYTIAHPRTHKLRVPYYPHLKHILTHSSIHPSQEILALNMASSPLPSLFLADLFLCHCISISDSLAAYTNFPLHLCLKPLSTCCQVCCSACVVVLLHASLHVFVMCGRACGPMWVHVYVDTRVYCSMCIAVCALQVCFANVFQATLHVLSCVSQCACRIEHAVCVFTILYWHMCVNYPLYIVITRLYSYTFTSIFVSNICEWILICIFWIDICIYAYTWIHK